MLSSTIPLPKRSIAAGVISSCAAAFLLVYQTSWWMGTSLSSTRKMATATRPRRPNTYITNPTGKHTGTVIFFHGLGDTGAGWSAAMEEIREPHIKYICPTALPMPVTLNGGMRMPSWFDLFNLQIGGKEDTEGIKKVVKEIVSEMVAEEEADGIPSNRVLIGGFSQGGALALYAALTLQRPLAGAMALSSWLPLAGDFPKVASANKDIPILLCHGDSDSLVSPDIGRLTKEKMGAFVPNITAKIYRGLGHSSSPEEMRDVKAFIATCLP
ncbi:hypothetical protein RvY_10435 [Ramazzottius varieornatus]|uniref:palmitoyl-protein hydrolase n=1 Tax=Ramazzottius varieornatus TaxID=947166 RepID=A0A1D1VEU5_RAMVA|nr:hypothetical protein RvY_10435 [Ramazzottius varieornatus]